MSNATASLPHLFPTSQFNLAFVSNLTTAFAVVCCWYQKWTQIQWSRLCQIQAALDDNRRCDPEHLIVLTAHFLYELFSRHTGMDLSLYVSNNLMPWCERVFSPCLSPFPFPITTMFNFAHSWCDPNKWTASCWLGQSTFNVILLILVVCSLLSSVQLSVY